MKSSTTSRSYWPADGEPVQLVSTSLIEAGVDLDFPRVYQAWAPAESMQQAAGRCNRDGRLPSGRWSSIGPRTATAARH
ncbi:hypothetical protein [Streptomyces fodineus]|uniref:hypothetical protein n=1 Tax=Streptomyces fodineus TaxID=1904616 RepID=UPI000A9CB046